MQKGNFLWAVPFFLRIDFLPESIVWRLIFVPRFNIFQTGLAGIRNLLCWEDFLIWNESWFEICFVVCQIPFKIGVERIDRCRRYCFIVAKRNPAYGFWSVFKFVEPRSMAPIHNIESPWKAKLETLLEE